MLRMKLMDPDPAGSTGSRTTASLPLTISLGDGMELTVWVTNLKTQVVDGVLTATGTATLPGHDSDTFTARVRDDSTSAHHLVVNLTFGSLPMGPVDFAIDVSHLTGDSGACRATAVPDLLNRLVSGLGP